MPLSPVPERAPADTGFRVCVRARPALPHEHDEYLRRDAVRVDSSNEITVGGDDSIGPDFARSTTYRFDRVFAPDVGQAAVYEHCARPAVTSLFDGFNSTVMAYGQTGAGKTFTVEGEGHVERAGILPRAARDIFALTSGYNFEPPVRFAVRASYLEIYQEHLTDLLAPADAERPAGGLAIREDRRRGLFVEGLSEWEVRSPADIAELAHRGGVYRHTAATEANASSSRSHAVFVIVVEQFSDGVATGGGDGDGAAAAAAAAAAVGRHRVAKLNLVDLAGSERIGTSGLSGQRLQECRKINASLSALGARARVPPPRNSRAHFSRALLARNSDGHPPPLPRPRQAT